MATGPLAMEMPFDTSDCQFLLPLQPLNVPEVEKDVRIHPDMHVPHRPAHFCHNTSGMVAKKPAATKRRNCRQPGCDKAILRARRYPVEAYPSKKAGVGRAELDLIASAKHLRFYAREHCALQALGSHRLNAAPSTRSLQCTSISDRFLRTLRASACRDARSGSWDRAWAPDQLLPGKLLKVRNKTSIMQQNSHRGSFTEIGTAGPTCQ